jgi:hypothetical protein
VKWFAQHRQDWIEDTLYVFGFINREHLMRKFEISRPQASADLQRYMRDNPGEMSYNLTTKRYEKASVAAPHYHDFDEGKFFCCAKCNHPDHKGKWIKPGAVCDCGAEGAGT